jgi:hypothetical protein
VSALQGDLSMKSGQKYGVEYNTTESLGQQRRPPPSDSATSTPMASENMI